MASKDATPEHKALIAKCQEQMFAEFGHDKPAVGEAGDLLTAALIRLGNLHGTKITSSVIKRVKHKALEYYKDKSNDDGEDEEDDEDESDGDNGEEDEDEDEDEEEEEEDKEEDDEESEDDDDDDDEYEEEDEEEEEAAVKQKPAKESKAKVAKRGAEKESMKDVKAKFGEPVAGKGKAKAKAPAKATFNTLPGSRKPKAK